MSLYTQHDVHVEDTHEEDDATMHASAPIADEPMHEADVSQHGLVDMLDFNFLVNCTTTLEKSFVKWERD